MEESYQIWASVEKDQCDLHFGMIEFRTVSAVMCMKYLGELVENSSYP